MADGGATPVLTYNNAQFPGPAVVPTKGSVIFATNNGAYSDDNANFFYDATNKFLGVGTATPLAAVHIAGNISGPAWTTFGAGLRVANSIYNDTTSSGTVAVTGGSGIDGHTLTATNPVTYTHAAALVLNGPPTASTNVTFTNTYCLYAQGAIRCTNKFLAPQFFGTGENISANAWSTNGLVLRTLSGTLTDLSSSGTVAKSVSYSFNIQTIAANSSVTYTDLITLYIQGVPTNGTNVSRTNAWSLYIAGGGAFIGGGMTFADTANITFNTTTGTKIGNGTTQKIGFWNVAPVAQPTTAVAAATFVAGAGTAVNDASTFDGYTLKQVVKALRNIGLLA